MKRWVLMALVILGLLATLVGCNSGCEVSGITTRGDGQPSVGYQKPEAPNVVVVPKPLPGPQEIEVSNSPAPAPVVAPPVKESKFKGFGWKFELVVLTIGALVMYASVGFWPAVVLAACLVFFAGYAATGSVIVVAALAVVRYRSKFLAVLQWLWTRVVKVAKWVVDWLDSVLTPDSKN